MHGQRIANADKARNNVERILALVIRDNAEIPQAGFRRAADGGIVGNGCVAAVLDVPNHALPHLCGFRIRLVINRMDLDARLVDSLVVLDLPDKR